MVKWPQLILPQFCTTDIDVIIESEDLNENGTPKVLGEWSGKCNYQDKVKRVYMSDKTYIEATGICLIPSDIAPQLVTIPSGRVTVLGIDRELVMGTKARNPDGSVNYTELVLK